MEENKKEGIKLLPLIVVIIFVLMILSYTYLMMSAVDKPHKEVSVATEGRNEIVEEEQMEDEISGDSETTDEYDYEEFYEEDFGNKVDPSKKYVYVKENMENTFGTQESETYSELQWIVININSEEVEKINKELEDYYKKYSPYCVKERYENNPELYPRMFHSYTASNGILSLGLYYGNEDDGEENVKIYNIDIKKGTVLSNEQLLESVGISKKDFEKYLDNSLKIHYLSFIATEREFEEKYPSYESFVNDVEFTDPEKETPDFKIDAQLVMDNCFLEYSSLSDEDNYTDIDIIKLRIPNPYYDGEMVYSYYPDFQIVIDDTYLFSNQYYFWTTDLFDGTKNYVNICAPTINLDSEDARKVSKELLDFYNNAKDTLIKNSGDLYITSIETDQEVQMPDGTYVKTKDEIVVNESGEHVIDDYYTIGYRYSIIDDKVLHIIVEKTNSKYSNLDHGLWEYESYDFDIETGKLLTNKEFIEKCGFNSEEFAKNIKDGRDIEDVEITVFDYQEVSEDGAYEKEKINGVKELFVVPQVFYDPWIKVHK